MKMRRSPREGLGRTLQLLRGSPLWEEFHFFHHYNLLCDPRLAVWEEAVARAVRASDVVVELGSGTGILSMCAARTARKVYAVERDPHLAEFSRCLCREEGLEEKVEVINADARHIALPEEADVILCEMIDTAFIEELVVPALRSARALLLRPGGTIVPCRGGATVQLVRGDYDFHGFSIPLPHFETAEVRRAHSPVSRKRSFLDIDFYRYDETHVEAEVAVTAERAGAFNSLRLETSVELLPGLSCPSSNWFNPPLVLPLWEMDAAEGQEFIVTLSYELGGGLSTLDYDIREAPHAR